jgi:hypothetical protein
MRRSVGICSLLLVSLTLAACSSSSSSSPTSSNSGGAGGNGASGSPVSSEINIMIQGQFQAPTFAFPEARDAALARVKAVNDAGGVNGHKVNAIVCNDQGNPNIAEECAREAVSDHVVADVSGWGQFDSLVLPILQSAGIPFIGQYPNTPQDFTSTVSFPLDGGNALFAALGQALVTNSHAKKVAIIKSNLPVGVAAGNASAIGVEMEGGKVTLNNPALPPVVPDYGPIVQQALAAGTDAYVILVAGTEKQKLTTAIEQSSKPDLPQGDIYPGFDLTLLPSLSQYPGNFLVSSGYVASSPQAAQYRSELAAYNPSTITSAFGESSWTATGIILGLAKSMTGKVTSSTMLAALNKDCDVTFGGIYPKLNFCQPGPVPEYPRLFNTNALVYNITGGKLVYASTFSDAKAFAAYAKTAG